MQKKEIILSILAVFGVIFLALLAHEATHVFQSKEPISICYDFQQATMAHVLHNTTGWATENNHTAAAELAAFHDWDLYTEKWAGIVEFITYVLGGMLIGIIITLLVLRNAGALYKGRNIQGGEQDKEK